MLSDLEIISYATAINRIKYPRLVSVYLSDMQASEERDPNIWQFFLEGYFSVQLNRIEGTAKGVDNARDQENKKLKIQGDLIGIPRQENSRNKFSLISLVVSEKEQREISHLKKKETKVHLALNQNKN